MRRAASENAKLEALFGKIEAAFPFEKYLTRMNESFKALDDAGQPMYEQQKVQFLLCSICDKYLANYDAACITLSQTAVSSRFALSEPGKSNKRTIGATTSTKSRGGSSRGSGRSSNRSCCGSGGQKFKVVMNGVDVSDINRNFTSDEWEILRT